VALTPVANDQLATVVTTLEMRRRPALRPSPLQPASPTLRLVAWPTPDPDKYRALFRRVGAPWLWFSRLAIGDEALVRIIHDPAVSVFAAVDRAGIEVGMVELDHRQPRVCEISYFALVPELAGQGHGRWLMAETLARAWRSGVERVWLHTCTLDHPSALGFYRAQGFRAVARTLETFADPRVAGMLPPEAAPQIPCLATPLGG
jgi:GNAT superfamily N-acetyltransferase